MKPIGLIAKILGRSGRVFGRVLGPVAMALTIGEMMYLGLKYSGTLEKFKELFCKKCRAEIPRNLIHEKAKNVLVGKEFIIKCPRCKKKHVLIKEYEPCKHCKKPLPVPEENDSHVTCPNCGVINNLTKT